MKKLALVLFISILAVCGYMGYKVYTVYEAVELDLIAEQSQPLIIEDGDTARSVLHKLSPRDLDPLAVKLYLYLRSDLVKIQKGRYHIDGRKSIYNLLQDMVAGKILVLPPMTVTLVEGMSYHLFDNRLKARSQVTIDLHNNSYPLHYASLDGKSIDVVASLLKDKSLIKLFPQNLRSLEGLLLPATYPYYENYQSKDVVAQALNAMAVYLAEQWPQRSTCRHLKTPYQALILASIIEKESSLKEEMPMIAGVFCNRLQQGIRLQTDASVRYGQGPNFKGNLYHKHLKAEGEYNTYKFYGLPPTPIAMPSSAAIDAALHPAITTAIYFVAKDEDPSNGHVFSSTLKEHNQAVSRYKQKVRAYKRSQLH